MRRRFFGKTSEKVDLSRNYFKIEALEDGLTTKLSNNACEYCIDNGTWSTLPINTDTVSINAGQTLSFRGNLITTLNYGIGTFNISKKCNLKGNIMSLIYGEDFADKTDLTGKGYVFYNLFYSCNNIVDASELILPATTLAEYCYAYMFYGCTSLTTAPELPATTLSEFCYENMFSGCTSLTTAPELPATTLAIYCYRSMFYGCSKLNNITMLATNISANYCLHGWVSGVASTGTFVKHPDMNSLPNGNSGIPSGWSVKDSFTPVECTSLTITAEDVHGNNVTTTITYTAVISGYDVNKNPVTITRAGTVISEPFPQNTSETETVIRTISYTYMGVTATTTITQGVWVTSYYTVNLNDNWRISDSISNPDSTTYDGVYESYSNYYVNNGVATMYIDICGYEKFSLYIRSNAESNNDYVMVSQLDKTITGSSSYSDTTLVKSHTRGSQSSITSLSGYKLVEFTGIDGKEHRITIVYRKDSSVHSGDDRGYVLIKKDDN